MVPHDRQHCSNIMPLVKIKQIPYGLIALILAVLAFVEASRNAISPHQSQTDSERMNARTGHLNEVRLATTVSSGGASESDSTTIHCLYTRLHDIPNGEIADGDESWRKLMEKITPRMVEQLLSQMPEEELTGELGLRLFDVWASAAPHQAASWASRIGCPESEKKLMMLAASRWATVDLEAASQWAMHLPEGEARNGIIESIALELIGSNPIAALQMLSELSGVAEDNPLVARASAEWALKDSVSAMAWAHQIEDESLRREVIAEISVASARNDPQGAAENALLKIEPGVEQDRAVVAIVQIWGQADPVAVSHWINKVPDGSLRQHAVENLVSLWAEKDLIASSEWLLALQCGESRLAGIEAYADVLKRFDNTYAARWRNEASR